MAEGGGIRRHVVHRPADRAQLEEVRGTAVEEPGGIAGELGRDAADEPGARGRLAFGGCVSLDAFEMTAR